MPLKHRMQIPGHKNPGPEIQRQHRKPVVEAVPELTADQEIEQLARRLKSRLGPLASEAHQFQVEHTPGKLVVRLELREGPAWVFSGSYMSVTKTLRRPCRLVIFLSTKTNGQYPEERARALGCGQLQGAADSVDELVRWRTFES